MRKLWAVLVIAGIVGLLVALFADLGWAQLLGPRVPGGPRIAPGGPPGARPRPPRPPRYAEEEDEEEYEEEEGGEGTMQYDLPRARRLMSECEQLITRGKSLLQSNNFKGAIGAFSQAKQKIELVRGWYQEQTGEGGEESEGPPAPAGRMGPARAAPPPMAMGGYGEEGGETTGLSGLIPPGYTEDLLRARRIHANVLMGLADAWLGNANDLFAKGRGTRTIWTPPGGTTAEGGEGGGEEE